MEAKGFELGAAARTPAKSCEAADMAALGLTRRNTHEGESKKRKEREKGAACRLEIGSRVHSAFPRPKRRDERRDLSILGRRKKH